MAKNRDGKHGDNVRQADKEYQKEKRKRISGYKTEEYRKYCERYPERIKANQALNRAIKNGKIKKSPCVECGATYWIHGHHPNYSEPYKVIWLCARHHKKYKHNDIPL